jgi:hypothetical protein
MDRLATSILAREALLAYLIFPSRLVKIYVPFVTSPEATNGLWEGGSPGASWRR